MFRTTETIQTKVVTYLGGLAAYVDLHDEDGAFRSFFQISGGQVFFAVQDVDDSVEDVEESCLCAFTYYPESRFLYVHGGDRAGRRYLIDTYTNTMDRAFADINATLKGVLNV